ncbi:MAG: hypothetical protein ACI4XS_02535 [Bacillus sp. (in: firmicutes)]
MYHEDKQQAFQDAQEATKDVKDILQKLDRNGNAYGAQVKHLKTGIIEAYEQIDNALEVASEHQRHQLQQYKQELQSIMNEMIE